MKDWLCALFRHPNYIRLKPPALGFECPCQVFVATFPLWRYRHWYNWWRWLPWRLMDRLLCGCGHHDWVPDGSYNPLGPRPCWRCNETKTR